MLRKASWSRGGVQLYSAVTCKPCRCGACSTSLRPSARSAMTAAYLSVIAVRPARLARIGSRVPVRVFARRIEIRDIQTQAQALLRTIDHDTAEFAAQAIDRNAPVPGGTIRGRGWRSCHAQSVLVGRQRRQA
jgi:hypothetical protein